MVAYIAVFIGGLITCYLLISLGVVDKIDGLPGAQEAPAISLPTYLSFVSVLLTAITVVLTAIAIGIGVVAAFTFRDLKDEARKMAQTTVEEEADKALSEDVIKARINEVAFAHLKPEKTLEELEEGFDPTDTGDR